MWRNSSQQYACIVMMLFTLFAAVVDAQQCRRINSTNSGSFPLPWKDIEDACFVFAPPDDKAKIAILLTAPPSVMFTVGGKAFDLNAASKDHCLILTPFTQCEPWQEKIQQTCPGNAALRPKPIFGPTTVSFKASDGNSSEEIDNVTITYKYVHRFDGFFNGPCKDLERPVETTTQSTMSSETTTPRYTPGHPRTMSAEAKGTTDTTIRSETSTPISVASPTTSPKTTHSFTTATANNSRRTAAILLATLIPGIIAVAIIFIGIYVCCGRKNERVKTGSNSSVDGGHAEAGVLSSTDGLLKERKESENSESAVDSVEMVTRG